MDYYSSLFASKVSGGGGGGGSSVTVEALNISENGTYTAPEGKAYSPVNVNVSGGVSIIDIIERTNFPETVVYDGTHTINSGTFSKVTGLKSFTATKNIGLEGTSFNGCTTLESVSMPLCEANAQTNGYIFEGCTSLSSVNLPKVKLLGQNIFKNCTSLKKLVLPKITALRDSFAYGSGLEKVDLGVCSSFQANSHFYNSALSMLVLRNTGVCGLNNINTFSGTPFASGNSGGTLYVPESLISSYQSATNWSTILGYANNQIKSIESTHTDPTAPIDLTLYYVDGTPIS